MYSLLPVLVSTMAEDVLKMSQESLSLGLYYVMERAGASIEERNKQKEFSIACEIIESVICNLFWGCSYYLFGSQYEGTSLSDMGSDFDKVFVLEEVDVETNLQDYKEMC